MKNVTLDRTTVLQLDADGTDCALDAAADRHVLRNDAALDLCAIVDLKIRGAHLAFDSAEDLRWTFAFDVDQRSPWRPLIRLLSGGSSMRFHCWSLSMSSRPLCFYPFCIVGLKGDFVSFLAAPSNVGKSRWPSIAPRA